MTDDVGWFLAACQIHLYRRRRRVCPVCARARQETLASLEAPAISKWSDPRASASTKKREISNRGGRLRRERNRRAALERLEAEAAE